VLTHKKQEQKIAGKFAIYYARNEKILTSFPSLVDKTAGNKVTSTGRHTAAPVGPN
jgi:hypothetical protein